MFLALITNLKPKPELIIANENIKCGTKKAVKKGNRK